MQAIFLGYNIRKPYRRNLYVTLKDLRYIAGAKSHKILVIQSDGHKLPELQ